ncbi:MAG: RNA methyltransferase [Proteobacteria bacterium]|nr:RNA methyltransferase [Pseudomonadota bacterium]
MAKIIEVSSLNNPQVKAVAGLHLKKARAESALFVVEGLQLVGFGVEAGWELITLVVNRNEERGSEERGAGDIVARVRAAAGVVLEVSAEVMEKVSRKDNPQGVVGVFRQRLVALKNIRPKGVWVVLEGVRDPGNLGTIIRTVDAVGAEGVILVGNCTDVWAPETVRATMGSIFHVPLVACSREAFLEWRQGFAGPVVGTHLQGTVDYREVPAERPLLLCMGTEQSGLTGPMSAACNTLVRIPMRGRAESLNLAIATGVLLYEVERNQLPVTSQQ